MSAEIIFNVSQALRARLDDALGGPGKVFVGPLDDPDAKNASLVLFLYRIAPNPSLRNREHRVISDTAPPEVITYNNSLPLTLHYLITVGTGPSGGDQPDDLELKWLGLAMRALNDEPELTDNIFGEEPVRLSLEPVSTEEMSRIWTLFPTANYRTSVAYVATPVWIDPKDRPVVASRVVEDRLGAGAKSGEPVDA